MGIKDLLHVSILKTVYFNIRVLPFNQAVRCPFLIYRNVFIKSLSGRIVFTTAVHPGMAKIGGVRLGTQVASNNKTVLGIDGSLILNGSLNIGSGTKIGVGKEGKLVLGNNFNVTGSSEIICEKEIVFGEDCLLSWSILIMDTDFHPIFNQQGVLQNPNKPIIIGNNVWIGCRSTVLKGVSIADNSVIASNSTIRKNCERESCIYGDGSKLIKDSIVWRKY